MECPFVVWADAAVDDDDARAQFGSDPLDTSAGASDDATAEEVVNEAANDAEPTVDDTPNIRVHMLTDIPAPSADIVTAVVFPNNQNKGACAFSNGGALRGMRKRIHTTSRTLTPTGARSCLYAMEVDATRQAP